MWMVNKKQSFVPTLGYTKRMNFFITLFWPSKKIIWNAFKRRRNIEFRFIDRATYHKTPEVKKFVKEHKDILRIKFLGKGDPNSNPIESLVNRRLSSAVGVDRFHASIDVMTTAARNFLRKYNSVYAT
jgi:hypothetical protein